MILGAGTVFDAEMQRRRSYMLDGVLLGRVPFFVGVLLAEPTGLAFILNLICW